MAYDKVVDSSVLNAGLTKIADAIRAKGGTSGQLAFPDGLAAAIEAIEAGGGAKIAAGTYTVASSGANITIEHNLGAIPNFICVVQAVKNTSYYVISFAHMGGLRSIYGAWTNDINPAPDITAATNDRDAKGYNIFAYNATANSIKIGIDTNSLTCFSSGQTFNFAIGVL